MPLPNPGMDFNPFDTLTAAQLDDLVENIEALESGSAPITAVSHATTAVANPYKFSAFLTTTGGVPAGFAHSKILLDTENFDTNSNFDSTTNRRYTAPVNGFYYFSAQVGFFVSNTVLTQCFIYKNGAQVRSGAWQQNLTGGNNYTFTVCAGLLSLVAGDYVEVWGAANAGSAQTVNPGSSITFFDGFLLSRT